MSKICKFFVKGNCRDGEKCKFKHEEGICRNYFFDTCRVENCKFKHTAKLEVKKDGENGREKREGHPRRKVKNTETFEPSHKLPDMRVLVANCNKETYDRDLYSRDVIIATSLFGELDNDMTLYNRLLEEVKIADINKDIWKLWHGDTHLIADDHLGWKTKCPTFGMVVDKLAKYFKMDVKASRFNWYRDLKEWKPFHHDAAAVDPKKAKTQNFTVGISFGATRDAAFEHATTKTVTSFPLANGSTYAFAKDVNMIWRHGIPQLSDKVIEDHIGSEGRISIIIWGYSEMIEC
jgi:hypothetical protein